LELFQTLFYRDNIISSWNKYFIFSLLNVCEVLELVSLIRRRMYFISSDSVVLVSKRVVRKLGIDTLTTLELCLRTTFGFDKADDFKLGLLEGLISQLHLTVLVIISPSTLLSHQFS